MRKSGYNLGGEQSGHVILMDYNTTGDGQLSAVQLTKIMKETKELVRVGCKVTIYPQKLVNIRVENAVKEKAMEVPKLSRLSSEDGRRNGEMAVSLFALSGTEPFACYGRSAYDRRVGYYV